MWFKKKTLMDFFLAAGFTFFVAFALNALGIL